MTSRRQNNHTGRPEKAPTGITGFDEIAHGGLPRGRTSLLMGGPGSGKTIFALQSLVHGARDLDEPGIFVAFEENTQELLTNAASFTWDLPHLVTPSQPNQQPRLFFLDTRLSPDTVVAGTFDLTGLLAILDAKVKQLGAKRIVFDGIDVLLTLLDDPGAERQEIYRLHDWLQERRLTAILTAKATDSSEQMPSQYSFIQFMVDCMVVLSHQFYEQVSLRRLCIIKYRGSDSSVNQHAFAIGPAGIEVTSPGRVELVAQVSPERISSGIERLDQMLSGGYYRGSNILITGAPGTGKTTLAGAFAEAACRRGERVLYISFDESGEEIVRNLASVTIRLAPYVQQGLLHLYSARTEARSADEHQIRLEQLIREQQPDCVVIDPLSALMKVGGREASMTVAQHLLRLAKGRGITILITSLLGGGSELMEMTPLEVSTLADTWLHLTYVIRAGERNRAITTVKSRGTAHSNQVRELVMSDQGVTLAEVYTAGGEVLMGTARWEKETAEQLERERERTEMERKRQELEIEEAEVAHQMAALQAQLEMKKSELALLTRQQALREKHWVERREALVSRRGGEIKSEPNPSHEEPRASGRKRMRKGGAQ